MYHYYYINYVSSSLSNLLMEFQNITHFQTLFMSTSLKPTQCNEYLAVCINYAFCAKLMLHYYKYCLSSSLSILLIDAIPKHLKNTYYKYYVSSFLSILLMQFQNIWNFQVIFMPTSLKTTQCNEFLAVCINYAFSTKTLHYYYYDY